MSAVISTDVVPAPWLDAQADAQRLPFAAASFDNIAMFDVLHHLERPRLFFQEAERVLGPGGRVVMIEPAITPLSGLFYRNFHPEPVIMSADPLLDGPLDPMPDAFEANQATSRCSYSTSLAIWSGARYGEAMHTLGRRLACGTETIVSRYRSKRTRLYFRGDGAFASPDLDEFLEVEGVGYSIPLSANRVLQENKGWEGMEWTLTRLSMRTGWWYLLRGKI